MILKKLMILSVIFTAFFACNDAVDKIPPNASVDEIAFSSQYLRTRSDVQVDETITIITSRNQLEAHYEKHRRCIRDGQGNELPDIDFLSAIEKYTDGFFANNFLVAVNLMETSGSFRHRVESIDTNGEILIKRSIPEVATQDIARWVILIELDNKLKDKQFDVTVRDINDIPFNAQYVRTQCCLQEDVIVIITSRNQLEAHYEKHRRRFGDGQGNELPDIDFLSAIEKYTDGFFANNFLVAVNLIEGSGSIRHKVENIDENGEILIKRLGRGHGTDDMAAWSIFIEIDNVFRHTQFEVRLVDVNGW